MDDTAKDSAIAKNRAIAKDDLAKQAVQAARLDALEVALAYLEDMVDVLNKVVAVQDKQLAEQQIIIKKLAQKIEATKTDAGIAAFDVAADKPPHY